MIVKILGTGCAKCKTLEQRIIALKEKHELDIQIEKVNQLEEFGYPSLEEMKNVH